MKNSIFTFLLLVLLGLLMLNCNVSSNQKNNKNLEVKIEPLETNDSLSLKIVRNFSVRPEVVFDVFTNPKSMRVWWTEDTSFDINLKVGGRWTITRNAGDMVYTATGNYLEIDQPTHLKYSYAMPQFSPNSDTISFDIVPAGNSGSVITYKVEGKDIASELRELAAGTMSQSEQGWRQALDLMEASWKNE